MRPLEPLVETLAGAFAPLRCGIDLVGHGGTVHVRIFDASEGDVVRGVYPLSQLQDERGLRTAIRETRLFLGEAGYCLEAWPARSSCGLPPR